VTLRVVEGLRSLRSPRSYNALFDVLKAGCDRNGFRLVEYSVQTNHVHLICEAEDRKVLSRGIQGLSVRMVKALNRVLDRTGGLFADRYHDHVLRTPREVRNALAYVLGNAARHGIHHIGGIDPCSSAVWFHGITAALSPLARARTWLLTEGWKRAGPIPVG
jgi:REP element-mobilizing transposase RayT